MRTSWSTSRNFVLALGGALALGSVAVAQTPSSVWTVPGTVNAGGLNNTRFVSDLAVTNPGSVPVLATISFIPANGTTPKQVTLNAGETVVYRNVLDRLWSAQGAGATQISCGSPLLIRARTYNTAASGTYGVALPVFADDRLLSPGDTADSLWISQSADGSSGYRTNVAVVFPDDGGGDATVTVYGADGSRIGLQDFSLDAPGFLQFAVGGFAGAVSIARARVRVSRGRAAGYSVVVDNITGDSSLFTFESLPAGRQDVLVNGAARANGRNNTFFRTDGRFYNPMPRDAVMAVAFHASGNSNGAPVTRDFTVPAGRILDVTDVLDSLLSIPVGSAGALRFTSNAPVAILCRTSNVDPAGVKPGTYGAQQKPASLLSFLMSADAGAVVTGIRQNATFRTNVGFAAGVDGAAYFLTLKSTSGATVATATGSLGAFGWTQPNIQDLFPTTTIPDDATLLVKVTSGSVDVFDSSIDNASGDPVVTPIMPLTVNIPSTATIGPQGGSIRSTDGRFTLKVPAGVLSAPTASSVVQVANDAPGGLGSAYEVTPDPLGAAGASRVVLTYLPADLEGTGPAALGVAVNEGARWRSLPPGAVDTVQRSITAPLSSTSGVVAGAPAARGALAPPATTRLALNRPVRLDPEVATLLTNQSLTLQLRASDPVVTTITRIDWSLGSSSPGTLTPNDFVATYTAPATASWDPVSIYVTYYVEGEPRPFTQNSQVRVVSRRWTLKATGKLGWSCGRIPACAFTQSYWSQQLTTFELDESFAISSVRYGEVQELINVQTTCSALFLPTVCPEPFYPVSPVVGLRVTGLSGQYVKENNVFAIRLNFANAFSGGGVWRGCTLDGKAVQGYSGGMEVLAQSLGFKLFSLVNTFVGEYSTYRIYRYEDIYFATVELLSDWY